VPIGLDDGAFVIGVPNDFAREWIERRLAKQVAEALEEVLGDAVEVKVVVDERAAAPPRKPAEAEGREPVKQAPPPPQPRQGGRAGSWAVPAAPAARLRSPVRSASR
jgi:chromosomal replication initiation ATPase DnaA